MTIKKEISNCIFSFLFVKIYYIIFDIFYPVQPITIKCNILTFSSVKTEINQTVKCHQKFIIWQFSIHGRKVKGWSRSCWPTFIKPIHCINYWFVVLYYPKRTVCKKPTFIIKCLYLPKKKRKIDVIVLAKDFIEDLGDTIINLALLEFLRILDIQYILGNQWFSVGMLSMPNLFFRCLTFLSMISFTDKPQALL